MVNWIPAFAGMTVGNLLVLTTVFVVTLATPTQRLMSIEG